MFSRARKDFRAVSDPRDSLVQKQGDENMLGIITAVLIVLGLLGFFAFHVTATFIHVARVVGLILLVLHFVRGAQQAYRTLPTPDPVKAIVPMTD